MVEHLIYGDNKVNTSVVAITLFNKTLTVNDVVQKNLAQTNKNENLETDDKKSIIPDGGLNAPYIFIAPPMLQVQ